MAEYEAVIGLEVHVQLGTESKAFSGSSTAFGAPPNSHTDPTVLGLPGALPVFNKRALEYALRLGLAVGSTVRRHSRFARKHYFYPDLPKGYQISQFDEPLLSGGAIEFSLDGEAESVPLTRIHLEEDAGKNMHRGAISLVDLNRAGVPLCEVVSEPAIRSAREAAAYMRALRELVRYLGISEGNMERGHLRCDANVSLRPAGATELGTRTELKNINSFRFVENAIEHEIARQEQVLRGGGEVVQETRLWDADAGLSRSMRSKEEAMDYRYFPDPDLPPLEVSNEEIERLRSELPELPAEKRGRFVTELGLSLSDASLLASERALADYFDAAVAAYGNVTGAKPIANWIQAELLRELNRDERTIDDCPISGAALAELVALVSRGTISGKMAKNVFATMYKTGDSAAVIVEREGLEQISDEGAIEEIAAKIIADNPSQAAAFRGGKEKLLGFFVGQVMKATKGQASPQAVNTVLRRLLSTE